MDLFPSSDEVWLDGLASSDVFVFGLDEVGRGPLAGPVVASCVAYKVPAQIELPKNIRIRDSKKLSEKQRAESSHWLRQQENIYWSLAERSAQDIDRLNILKATFEAMEEAFVKCFSKIPQGAPYIVLVDGNLLPAFLKSYRQAKALVKGDSKSFAIAAASIIAKEYRDAFMSEIAKDFPDYAWDQNAGYGTEAHRNAIQSQGLTLWHRRSFCKNFATCDDTSSGETPKTLSQNF